MVVWSLIYIFFKQYIKYITEVPLYFFTVVENNRHIYNYYYFLHRISIKELPSARCNTKGDTKGLSFLSKKRLFKSFFLFILQNLLIIGEFKLSWKREDGKFL